MSYSAYGDFDSADLPEVEYKEIVLLKRRISKAAPQSMRDVRDIEHESALKMIAKKYPFISLDCVHGDIECCELYVTIKYYLKVALP